MLGKKIGIDLGSSTIRVLVKGDGLVLEEPAVVALGGDGRSIHAVGANAVDAVEHDPKLRLMRPLRGIHIDDVGVLSALITHVVNRSAGRQRIFKPDLVVVVHSALGGDERRSVLDALALTNARTIYLIDAPMAAGLGAGLMLTGNRGHMVVDVGVACAEVAIIAGEGTISGRTVEARSEWHNDIGELVRDVVNAGREVLAEIPQSMLPYVRDDGATLVGGGSTLSDLDEQLCAAWGMPVRRVHDPHLCAVRGAQIAVDSLDVLKRNFMYMR